MSWWKSQIHDRLEPATGHAFEIEWRVLGIAHLVQPRVGHDLFVHAVAVFARLVDDVGENDSLAGFDLREFRKRGGHSGHVEIVAGAFDVFEGAVFLPKLAGFSGDFAIGRKLGLFDGENESVDIAGHGVKGLRLRL